MSVNQKIVWTLVIGLGLGFVGGYLFFHQSVAPAINTNQTPSSGMVANDTAGVAFSVANQLPGEMVRVTNVKAAADTWLAVHEEKEGSLANILGALIVHPGGEATTTIDLLRGTIAGNTYDVVAYTDNGDGQFDPKVDKPVLEQTGKPLKAMFTTMLVGAHGEDAGQ